MKNNKTFLCIIPARGGSKGIPNKNIIDLNGNPLIYYSIKCAQDSGIFDKIIVSTDSLSIKKIVEEYGIEVPYLRPSYLSNDNSKIEDTISYLLKNIEKENNKYDYVCLLQPTSPLRNAKDIINSISLLFKKNAEIIVSVGKNPIKKEWIIDLPEDLSLKEFSNNVCGSNRQCFNETYFLNGAIYIGEWDIFYNKKDYYSQESYAYVMPYKRSIDIDSYDDLKLASFFLYEKEK